MKIQMTFALMILACLFSLGADFPAQAAVADGKPVDSNGMRITVLKPWELLTSDTDGKKLKQGLGIMLSGEGEILGEGWARVYPAKKSLPLPTPEKLRSMDSAALQDLVRDLKKSYEGFSEEDKAAPSLVEINHFTAIVAQWKEESSEETRKTGYANHEFNYYFVLQDRLVTLHAGGYGDEAAGKLLERICLSFVPDTGAKKLVGLPKYDKGASLP